MARPKDPDLEPESLPDLDMTSTNETHESLDQSLEHVTESSSTHGLRPSLASPTPSRMSSTSEQASMPYWAREAAISLHSRPSRASSIVSTRTRTSVNTLNDDARSIDISIGGRTFRINRDASRITTFSQQDDLPPYSPPLPENVEFLDVNRSSNGSISISGPAEISVNRPEQAESIHPIQDQQSLYSNAPVAAAALSAQREDSVASSTHLPDYTPSASVDSIISSHQPTLAPTEDTTVTKDAGFSRNPSFTPGREVLSVDKRRTVSYSDAPDTIRPRSGLPLISPPLRRRNGVRLPKLMTGISGGRNPHSGSSLTPGSASGFSSASANPQFTRSAGPTFASDDPGLNAPKSPSYIGRGASGMFPSSCEARELNKTILEPDRPENATSAVTLIVPQSPPQVEEGHADTHVPPSMDTENDISIHYTCLIRSIDRDHRKALHARDKELGEMRERLNEVDQVYRKELKAKDFIIDDLRKRLTALEVQTQSKTENACNEVEDLWETRWKDRDRHLVERMRRIELDSQQLVERAVAERDEEWASEWAKKNEQLLQRLKITEETARQPLNLSS